MTQTLTHTTQTPDATCFGQVITRHATQEWFETASRDAGRRAKHLRSLGFQVIVESMGTQVTEVGRVKMTLVTILAGSNEDHHTNLPPVRIVRV